MFEQQQATDGGTAGGVSAEAPLGAPVRTYQLCGPVADDAAGHDGWAGGAEAAAPLLDEPEWNLDGSDDLPPGGAHAPWESLAGVEDVAPDGMLALVLEEVDVTTVDDRMLVETIAGWQRIAAWAQLNSALGAAELARRDSMNPSWNVPIPADPNVAGDELAMRLAWSRRSAQRLVRDGRALGNELLLVAEAVREGRLDTAKLRVLCDRLHDWPGELAWAVQEAVLPGAAARTPTQLAADVDRALLSVDPLDAADRLARAIDGRHVCHPRRLPDGMAGIWAVLPADQAVRIDATLEATARTARALGDPRTLDQLRADVLFALASGQTLPEGDASQGPTIRIPRVRIDVTVALSTLLRLDDEPADLAGFGPISAEQARAFAAGGAWRRIVTDPLSGTVLDVGRTRYRPPRPLVEHVMARDHVCVAPGCPIPAGRCDIDHTTEYHGVPANGSAAPDTTSADNLGTLSRRCHRIKTDGGFTLRQVAPGVFEWRTPAGLGYRVVPGDHGHTERLVSTFEAQPHRGYPDEPPF